MESMVPVCDKRYHIYNRFRHFWAEIKKLWNHPLQHASQLSRSEESEVQHTLMLFVYCRLKIFMVVLLSIVNSTSPLWLIWGSTQMDVVCVYILIKEQRSRSCYSKWTYGSIINESFQSHTNMPLNFPTVRKLIFNTPCYLFLIRKFCKTS